MASKSRKWPRTPAPCKKLRMWTAGHGSPPSGRGGGCFWPVVHPRPACPFFVLPWEPALAPLTFRPPVGAQLCSPASDGHGGRIPVASLPMVMESSGLPRRRLLISTHEMLFVECPGWGAARVVTVLTQHGGKFMGFGIRQTWVQIPILIFLFFFFSFIFITILIF